MKGRMIPIVLGVAMAIPGAAWGQQPPASPPPVSASEAPLAEDEALVLNFERADIREVIHSLATALGLSYAIDPAIEGQVTIRTTGRIPRKELFPLFNRILRNNGIAAVKHGEVYQIVPVDQAKGRARIPGTGPRRRTALAEDGFVIEIIAARHVAAEEMANIVQPFVTEGGEVFAYPRANAVVVTDLASNVARLRELAAAFDVDGFGSMRARVFELKEGDPEELANELLTLLAPYGVSGAGDGAGGIFLIPVYRLNAIVAFAYDPTAFDEIERWLTLLDIPPDKGSGRQTYVYHVENAKAADLAAVLNELFGGEGGSAGGARRRAGAAPAGVGLFGAGGVSGRRGTPGRGGGARAGANRARGQAGAATAARQQVGVGGQGRGARAGRGGRGGALRGGGGGGLAAPQGGGGAGVLGVSLPGGSTSQGAGATPGQPTGPPPIFKQEVRIVADEVTNSLVVLATRRDYQLILDILRRLDVVPRQVVLEVMIAEVSLGKGLEFGISYAYTSGSLGNQVPGDGDGDGDTGVTGSLFGTVQDIAGLVGNAAGEPAFPPGGAFAVLDSGDDFRAFLRALQDRTNVKVLSAPHIIAADNREAHIQVGNSIPILTSTSQSTLATANVVNSVQYRDTGKILTVLPQVNSKGLVNLQLRQEVSDVGSEEFGATGSPSFVTREVETTLVVENGETVLIGGIIDDKTEHRRSGVPYLMDIPVLGRAFRDESDRITRVELLITITPFVIRNREEARAVTEDFSSRIEGIRQLRDAMHRQYQGFRSQRLEYDEPDPMEGVPMGLGR